MIEAAGDAQLMADSLGLLRRSGVVCLLGIDGRDQRGRPSTAACSRVDTILENRVVFGSVNAHRQDWLDGVDGPRPRARPLARRARRTRRPARPARPLRGSVRLPRRQGDARARRSAAIGDGARASRSRRSARSRRRPRRRGSRPRTSRRTARRRRPSAIASSRWCSSCTNVSPQPMMWPGGHQCSQNGWSASETSTVLKPRARSPSARNTCSSFRRSMSNASEPFEPLISHWKALRRPSASRVASIVPTEPFSNSTAASSASSTLRPGQERLQRSRRPTRSRRSGSARGRSRACRGRRARPSRPRRDRTATCRASGRRPSPGGSGRGSGGSRRARRPRSSRARAAPPARSGS